MKQMMMGLVCGLMTIAAIVAVLTIEGRSSRESEMESALRAAVEEAMAALEQSCVYTVAEEEEFIADFNGLLLERIHAGEGEDVDENLSVQVDVTGCDLEKGLLSVCVTERFSHPGGGVGTVTCHATAVLEAHVPPTYHTVTYRTDACIYKQYSIREGQPFKVPDNPLMPGKTFVAWIDADTGKTAEFPEKADGSRTYIALFE